MTNFLVIKQSTCPECKGESQPTQSKSAVINKWRCATCNCMGVVEERVPILEALSEEMGLKSELHASVVSTMKAYTEMLSEVFAEVAKKLEVKTPKPEDPADGG